MQEQLGDRTPESAAAARKIRESLFDLHRLAESAGYGTVSFFLRLAIIEANHSAGADNVLELTKK